MKKSRSLSAAEVPNTKSKLHPRSKHKERYDFPKLIRSCPELKEFVGPNKYGDESIDFFNPKAVKALNKSLLFHFYNLDYWDIPNNYLCPPIPGRADYIHHIADLLASKNKQIVPKGDNIRVLDIGTGSNCIYPIIGNKEYAWSFVGTEIENKSLESSQNIVEQNGHLKGKIGLRKQENPNKILDGVISENEQFDLVICNPPFHKSLKEAQFQSRRKIKNLTSKKVKNPTLNFGGQANELWCEGGESKFVGSMIEESREFKDSIYWFSSLISKEDNLQKVYSALKKVGAVEVKTIPMGQGNKVSRIVAWTFLSPKEQKVWKEKRWPKIK